MKTLFEGHAVSWVTFNKGDPEAYIRLMFKISKFFTFSNLSK